MLRTSAALATATAANTKTPQINGVCYPHAWPSPGGELADRLANEPEFAAKYAARQGYKTTPNGNCCPTCKKVQFASPCACVTTVGLYNASPLVVNYMLPPSIGNDAFIVKYSTSGAVQWYTTISGTSFDYGQGIATDSTGVYASGYYNSTSTVALTNGDGTPSGKSLPISVGIDAFIVKYSTSGTVQWYTTIQGTSTDQGFSLATDSTGVYATGGYNSTSTVALTNGDGTPSGKSLPISAATDTFIVKYSTSGTVQWYTSIHGTSTDNGYGSATDSTGVYATGYYNSTTRVLLASGS